jgi:glycosyltransferase involved in cell wall biosynthesis
MSNVLLQELGNSSPRVSVIVPLFNKAQYVAEGLQSILDQRWRHLEILIRDDGSTDNSRETVQALMDRNPEADIKFFSSENRGVSFGRNFLIERASSPIVVMQDADDIMLPGFIDHAIRAMRATGARLVYSDVQVFGVQETQWKPPLFDPFGVRYANCIAASFCMIDRELWSSAGGFDEGLPFNEDWSFFMRVGQDGALVHRLEGVHFKHRQTETGLYHSFIYGNWSHNLHLMMVANPDLYAVEEVLEAARRLREMPPQWPAKFVAVNERLPSNPAPYLVRAIAAIQAGNMPTARTLLERCVQKCPKREWLAVHLLAELVESREPELAMNLYHHARIRRPDLSRIVNPRIDHLLAHIRGVHATQQ